ncbi:MAG: SpoIIE family protein phosphatase [Calditrichaeota bacterium]|nr:SpoIIE family protein phosphatase [Calditrichota bacterium]
MVRSSRESHEEHVAASTALERRLFELQALFEASQLLNASLSLRSILDTLLHIPMGHLMLTRGLIALHDKNEGLRVEVVKGGRQDLVGKILDGEARVARATRLADLGPAQNPWAGALEHWGFSLVLPLVSSHRELGLVAFGPKISGRDFEDSELDFLDSLARIAATAIENGLMFEELNRVNRRLDRKLQEMNTLFEISRELNTSLDENRIAATLSFAAMGEMLTKTCAVWQLLEGQARLLVARGLLPGASLKEDESFYGKAFGLLREPVRLAHSGEEASAELPELARAGFRVLVPLRVQDKTRGVLALGPRMDGRDYTEDDLSFLLTLGNHAAISLENARLFREALEKQRLEEELAIAREIQEGLLPKEFPDLESAEIWGVNIPTRQVGGDYFDCLRLGDESVGLAIADVSGKGTPASLLMANVQASLRTLAQPGIDLGKMVARINDLVHANTGFDKFVTFFYAEFNTGTGELRYVNAGHNPPYLVRRDGRVETLEEGGLLLGMLPNVEYQTGSARLEPGDLLVMFTDGVTEAQNAREEEFEDERLVQVLLDTRSGSAKEVVDAIVDAVTRFAGEAEQYDDITVLVLKMR